MKTEPSAPVERVEAAAILHEGKVWTLPRPARHHDVIIYAILKGVKEPEDGVFGFVLTSGKFATRAEAKYRALCSGQLLKGAPLNGSDLTSEDVW